MKYTFRSNIFSEGKRAFIAIPFNVWATTGLKGNIPCRITIEDMNFECKLRPKGLGNYYIPVSKTIALSLKAEAAYEICIEFISELSRINHASPYTREKPIRKIDSIRTIPVPSGYCGHCCVAMLADVPLEDVIALMGKGRASWSKILEALNYYGIPYAEKAVYPKGKAFQLPQCCIVNHNNTFVLWYQGQFWGGSDIDPQKITSYMEIIL